ncbi:MAG: response regulator [Candidatus Eremiobacteraeota bacterium]|nr:response regulator [Candidatus Eremiobacteraeota bacterium]
MKLTESELPAPVLRLDDQCGVVGCNSSALESIPELRDHEGIPLESLVCKEDWPDVMRAHGSVNNARVRARIAGAGTGEERWFEFHFGSTKERRVCLLRDIDCEVRHDEKELQEKADAFARLEQAQTARNRFLDIMSHELRTPLTAILGLSEALELGLYGDCSEEQKDAARTINECGGTLLRLINDILDVTKLETQKLQVQKEPLQATEVCKSVLGLNSKSARDKEVGLTSCVQPSNFRFQGDRKRLKQALSHLLDNAVKFTEHGGAVYLEVRLQGGDVVFSIRDQGPGIPSDLLPELLTTFTQSDQGLSRLHGGAGLGLRLSKRLVDLMDGTLEVRNQEEGGACFRLTLPDALLEDDPQEPSISVRGEGTILVVDDHQATAKLLRDALTTWGFEVETFSDAGSLRARSETGTVRAILMDGVLPDGSGIDCIHWLRQKPEYKDLPIVFLTASEGLEVKRAGMAAGASAHLEKPVKLVEIAHCLDYLLG